MLKSFTSIYPPALSEMPIIAPASKVLVSGANGYIATWVVRTLLEHGYAVRGTVRTETKGAFLVDMFRSYADKLELVVVEDIAKVLLSHCHADGPLVIP